ncbi:hypothetical protein SAE02_71300 [Skermanella aerolata]|uniref:Uncharacterized protein n=1 Tax=Skermanella aerolata TaxID=393310 RepID=A0A512E2L8_9PROT|nr:hypothetical protein SAE02_71300 [Skermanella aerolata]
MFGVLIYALGARSPESQVFWTTLVIGTTTVWFAYAYFAKIVNPLFAFIFCTLLCTDYLLFAQWHVVTYRVWYGFLVFGIFLCLHEAEGPRAMFARVGLAVMFWLLFYFELVFAGFISIAAGIYTLSLYRQQLATAVRIGVLTAIAGVSALLVLFVQLTLVFGLDVVLQDFYITFVARNVGMSDEGKKSIIDFFARNNIAFWQNFMDAGIYRDWGYLIKSLTQINVQAYTPILFMVLFIWFAGWAVASMADLRVGFSGVSPAVRRMVDFRRRHSSGLLVVGVLLGIGAGITAGILGLPGGVAGLAVLSMALFALVRIWRNSGELAGQLAVADAPGNRQVRLGGGIGATILAACLYVLMGRIVAMAAEGGLSLTAAALGLVLLLATIALGAAVAAKPGLAAAAARWLSALAQPGSAAMVALIPVALSIQPVVAATSGVTGAEAVLRGMLTIVPIGAAVLLGLGCSFGPAKLRLSDRGAAWLTRIGGPASLERGLTIGGLGLLLVTVPLLATGSGVPVLPSTAFGAAVFLLLNPAAVRRFIAMVILRADSPTAGGPAQRDIWLSRVPGEGRWQITSASVVLMAGSFTVLALLAVGGRPWGLPPTNPGVLRPEGFLNLIAVALACAAAIGLHLWTSALRSGTDAPTLWPAMRATALAGIVSALMWHYPALFVQDQLLMWTALLTTPGLVTLGRFLLLLTLAVCLFGAAAGPRTVFGNAGRGLGWVVVFLVAGSVAYGIIFYLSPGYVLTGYQWRHAPFSVFFTTALPAVGLYLLIAAVQRAYAGWRHNRRTAARCGSGIDGCFVWLRNVGSPGAVWVGGSACVLMVVGYWTAQQAFYVRLLPPDHVSFLKVVEREEFKGATFAVNNYAATIAWHTGTWGYYDPVVESGSIQGSPDDPRPLLDGTSYMWFADGRTNPAKYAQPDYYACLIPQSISTALARYQGIMTVGQECSNRPIFRKTTDAQSPLQHRIVALDNKQSDYWGIVKLAHSAGKALLPLSGVPANRTVVAQADRVSGGYRLDYAFNLDKRNGAGAPRVEVIVGPLDVNCAFDPISAAPVPFKDQGGYFIVPAEFEGNVAVRVRPRFSGQLGRPAISNTVRITSRPLPSRDCEPLGTIAAPISSSIPGALPGRVVVARTEIGPEGNRIDYAYRADRRSDGAELPPHIELLGAPFDINCAFDASGKVPLPVQDRNGHFILPAEFEGNVAVRVTPRFSNRFASPILSNTVRVTQQRLPSRHCEPIGDAPWPIAMGETILFRAGENADRYLRDGWSDTASDWGRWTVAPEAKLVIPLTPKQGGDLILTMTSTALVIPTRPYFKAEVLVNGEAVGMIELDIRQPVRTVEIKVPASILNRHHQLELAFRTADTRPPRQLAFGRDERPLGLGLLALRVDDVSAGGRLPARSASN